MSIDNTADYLDSRDIIERIEELRGMLDDESESQAHALTDEELAELESLDAFASEASGTPDWEYGATFIRDSYFQDYAQELAEELSPTSDVASWPLYCIDWEWAARELRMDYSAHEFDGVTYWCRD